MTFEDFDLLRFGAALLVVVGMALLFLAGAGLVVVATVAGVCERTTLCETVEP
jgi:hypothetical protein